MLPNEESKADLINQVCAEVRARLTEEQAPQVEAFVRHYYQLAAPEDLLHWDVMNLYGAALAHWDLMQQRGRDTPKVRVYNPQLGIHGWESRHTVVEAVTDDMPFLVESVRMALVRRSLTVHLVIHPVVTPRRDPGGRLSEFPATSDDASREAVLHFEVDRQSGQELLESLRAELLGVLEHVRAAVGDWGAMRQRLAAIAEELGRESPAAAAESVGEVREFLRWMGSDHFTFLGYREYELVREGEEDALKALPGSELGICRMAERGTRSQTFAGMSAERRALFRKPEPLVVTKANHRSLVHRPVYMDYVGVKRFGEAGRVTGERRFLGLFTVDVYQRNPWSIPLLRRKVASVASRAGFPPDSYDGRALRHILETYPRDELFQITEQELYDTAVGILHLQERQRVRLFVRRETFGRFYSCIVFVPRERYNTDVRERIQHILTKALHGTSSEFTVELSESVLARVYFIIRTPAHTSPEGDVRDIEAQLVAATREWGDRLKELLLERLGEERGNRMAMRYLAGFPAGYREDFTPLEALHDIEKMERLERVTGLDTSLYRPPGAPTGLLRFRVFSLGDPVPLSDALPVLENMGVRVLDERPYFIKARDKPSVWLHDFGMSWGENGPLEADRVQAIFQDMFVRVWRGEVESDGFNRLVLRARLTWSEIVRLRAYSKYLRQAGSKFSQAYMEDTLADHPRVARLLVALFRARFDPHRQGRVAVRNTRLATRLQEALDRVASLDQDRILRSFLAMIQATVRTNAYRHWRGQPGPCLAFKLDASLIPDLPAPRPVYEVFVYSPRVEGVHLRGGKVARGGIRWSDRREDYRTEVLGLMKAQLVKNAAIVPTGAKGGFIVKRPPPAEAREALEAEVAHCYQSYISALLDVTDNLVDGKVAPPEGVVRYDGDDPYLVVAADKGTATFSDRANHIAIRYRFWLGDAFASGGATGYDHKKMGITARGAWECVKRHFLEFGVDVDSTEITVVGIGDMSGDVFGNGMLRSRRIRLIGAFDHRHVFLDPGPDPEVAFRERERLFRTPRSSWADYDSAKISPGGGVFPRTAKSIGISPEVRAALQIQVDTMTPNDLIRALLRAPVDLLWNGGIGTFVKSSRETHAEVADRSNDAVRVNASELRCRVVAEGGNLGFTQLGRADYALAGGRINTDFIDNAGGVTCSDYEVNIKILLNQVMAAGELTQKQRNRLLADMTDEVAGQVLQESYWQHQAISLVEARAPQLLEEHGRFMRLLERSGMLKRRLERLPDDEGLADRQTANKGLTRPEVALLLAHSKNVVQRALLASDVPEDPYLGRELVNYFPAMLHRRFAEPMHSHRLRREIISTFLTNCMVNHLGPTFAFRLQEDYGADIPEVVCAYAVARETFGLSTLWNEIAALGASVPAGVQTEMMLAGARLAGRSATWLLRHGPRPLDIGDVVQGLAAGIAVLTENDCRRLVPYDRDRLEQHAQSLVERGVPSGLAFRVACLEPLYAALDILHVSAAGPHPVERVAAVHFELGAKLRLDRLREGIRALPAETRWQTRAQATLEDDLYVQQRVLTAQVMQQAQAAQTPAELVDLWSRSYRTLVHRCLNLLDDVAAATPGALPMFSVALGEIRHLVRSTASSEAGPAPDPTVS